MKLRVLYYLLVLQCTLIACSEVPATKSKASTQTSGQQYQAGVWQHKHPSAILDSEPDKNLYQLRVISQKGEECSLHEVRNLLFAMAMFRGDDKAFDYEYKRMRDNDLLEKMTLKTVCHLGEILSPGYEKKKPQEGESRNRRFPDIKGFMNDNADFGDYLPADSKSLMSDIIGFDRYIHSDEYKSLEARIKKDAVVIEAGNNLLPNFSIDAALLSSDIGKNNDIIRLFRQSEKMKASPGDLIIPVSLSLNSTPSNKHATALLIKKSQGKVEYIFLDPLNWKVSTTPNYKAAIDSIVRLTQNPTYFKESLIRSGYFPALGPVSWELLPKGDRFHGLRNRAIAEDLFGYLEVLEELSLLEDAFFKKYYKVPTCKLIREELKDPPIQLDLKISKEEKISYADAQAELIKRFRCDS